MSREGFEPTEEYAKLTSGDRVRIMCEFKAISQAELARRAGMHPTHVSAIINDKRPLGINLARRIAKALDISVSYLIEDASDRDMRQKKVSSILTRLKKRVHQARMRGTPIGEVTERHILKDLDELSAAL